MGRRESYGYRENNQHNVRYDTISYIPFPNPFDISFTYFYNPSSKSS